MSFILPRSLCGQLAALLCGTIVLMSAIAVAGFLAFRADGLMPPPGPWRDAIRIATMFRSISATPAPDQGALARSLSAPDLAVIFNTDAHCRPGPDALVTRALRRAIYGLNMADTSVPLVMFCADDVWRAGFTEVSFVEPAVTFLVRNHVGVHRFGMIMITLQMVLWLGTFALAACVLCAWSAWYVRRPLGMLAASVSQYEIADRPAPIDEVGPSDVRGVIGAFNAMQERLAMSAQTRVRALMGVAHDLRTPLTRLALRIEMGESGVRDHGMRRDIDLMKRMLESAMSLFQGHGESEDWQIVDLSAVTQEICADFCATGRRVHGLADHPVLLRCQPLAIARALGNLIENGCRYAENVTVAVRETEREIVINVRDDGPGMPMRVQRSVMHGDEPMHGGLSGGNGHFGLGLPIVAEIVCRHRGDIAFLDANPCGLLVRITLPRANSSDFTQCLSTERREAMPRRRHGSMVAHGNCAGVIPG